MRFAFNIVFSQLLLLSICFRLSAQQPLSPELLHANRSSLFQEDLENYFVYDVKHSSHKFINPYRKAASPDFGGEEDETPAYMELLKSSCGVPSLNLSVHSQGIRYVRLHTMENISPDDEDYQDFTMSHLVELRSGEGYVMSIDFGHESLKEHLRVYADYNNDGDFFDVGEEIYSLPNGYGERNFTFLVPEDVVTDIPLRVRAITTWAAVPFEDFAACSNPDGGQAEDYSIIVRKPAAASKVLREPITYSVGSQYVDLVEHYVAPLAGGVWFEWVSEGEGAVGAYILESSLDGESFEFVDKVSASGTEVGRNRYELMYTGPDACAKFFRLSVLHKNGETYRLQMWPFNCEE